MIQLVIIKFIDKEASRQKDDISDLLTILGKLFYISGFGFVIANIFQLLFSQINSRKSGMGSYSSLPSMNFRGEWDYLTFGIIIIFVGIAFKVGNRVLRKNRIE